MAKMKQSEIAGLTLVGGIMLVAILASRQPTGRLGAYGARGVAVLPPPVTDPWLESCISRCQGTAQHRATAMGRGTPFRTL
jgi:hypothetical protein